MLSNILMFACGLAIVGLVYGMSRAQKRNEKRDGERLDRKK